MGLSWQQGPLSPGAVGRFLVPEPLPERLLYVEPLRRRMRVRFAGDWISSWNSHDLSRILSHYADDFEMSSSPFIIQLAGEASGTLKSKNAVGTYWAKALQLIPDLRFELLSQP